MQLYMSTATPSTYVTGRHASDPNRALCDIADGKTCNSQMADRYMRRWFSGRILTCHATGPGSIPGWCGAYHQFKIFIYATVCR